MACADEARRPHTAAPYRKSYVDLPWRRPWFWERLQSHGVEARPGLYFPRLRVRGESRVYASVRPPRC